MKNHTAILINEKIGFPIFDESERFKLKIIKYSKKVIKQNFLDDLIDHNGVASTRLSKIVDDLLFKK